MSGTQIVIWLQRTSSVCMQTHRTFEGLLGIYEALLEQVTLVQTPQYRLQRLSSVLRTDQCMLQQQNHVCYCIMQYVH
jgi:hypothetical protein